MVRGFLSSLICRFRFSERVHRLQESVVWSLEVAADRHGERQHSLLHKGKFSGVEH